MTAVSPMSLIRLPLPCRHLNTPSFQRSPTVANCKQMRVRCHGKQVYLIMSAPCVTSWPQRWRELVQSTAARTWSVIMLPP